MPHGLTEVHQRRSRLVLEEVEERVPAVRREVATHRRSEVAGSVGDLRDDAAHLRGSGEQLVDAFLHAGEQAVLRGGAELLQLRADLVEEANELAGSGTEAAHLLL